MLEFTMSIDPFILQLSSQAPTAFVALMTRAIDRLSFTIPLQKGGIAQRALFEDIRTAVRISRFVANNDPMLDLPRAVTWIESVFQDRSKRTSRIELLVAQHGALLGSVIREEPLPEHLVEQAFDKCQMLSERQRMGGSFLTEIHHDVDKARTFFESPAIAPRSRWLDLFGPLWNNSKAALSLEHPLTEFLEQTNAVWLERVKRAAPRPLISVAFDGSEFSPDDVALVLEYLDACYAAVGGSGLKIVDGAAYSPQFEESSR